MRNRMRYFALCVLLATAYGQQPAPSAPPIRGFRNGTPQREWEKKFLAIPDAARARQHLRVLTQAPHLAGTPEDRATAEYVARQYRAAGLDTRIVEYKVWINYPRKAAATLVVPQPSSLLSHPERLDGDALADDPRVVIAYNSGSPSGTVEAEVVYANYGRPEDFEKLEAMHVDVRGKVLLIRYGQNYRGVKSFIAEQKGAAGVVLFSDPFDDGFFKGDVYPHGPMRPWGAVQRGSINYIAQFAGDPTTPGFASVPGLRDDQRTAPERSASLPKIPTMPVSAEAACRIMTALGGPESPREWQGALPVTYHIGPGAARVRLELKQDYALRTIWDVIGAVQGSEYPQQWVISGNHRDAWVYGAVDPNSGSAAQLETVHGIGALLKSGWKPRRTLVFASWDAEEFGLMGSTEWAEQHERELANAVAYLNMDAAVSGGDFGASAVPSLKQFLRDVTQDVPSPRGGSVYDAWKQSQARQQSAASGPASVAAPASDVNVGDLGSGSDFTPFLQHLGVPATDFGSSGRYGVYHSAFDNFNWFTRFGDPDFVYERQMAQVLGLAMLRIADADMLPFDYPAYARELSRYVDAADRKAKEKLGDKAPSFDALREAVQRFNAIAGEATAAQQNPLASPRRVNAALCATERAFLLPEGLPNRPWYRHAIYAPGLYTGYAAVVLPGINEALDRGDGAAAAREIERVTAAVDRATQSLGSFRD